VPSGVIMTAQSQILSCLQQGVCANLQSARGGHVQSIKWFWTIGIHDPLWVQAVATVALIVVALLALIILCRFAWDARKLANVSSEHIAFVKDERDAEQLRKYHGAYDTLSKIREDLISLAQRSSETTFGTRQVDPVYPPNWPQICSDLYRRVPDAAQPLFDFGLNLRRVDTAIREFLDASTLGNLQERKEKVHRILIETAGESESVLKFLDDQNA
jgi:hypothetical protein